MAVTHQTPLYRPKFLHTCSSLPIIRDDDEGFSPIPFSCFRPKAGKKRVSPVRDSFTGRSLNGRKKKKERSARDEGLLVRGGQCSGVKVAGVTHAWLSCVKRKDMGLICQCAWLGCGDLGLRLRGLELVEDYFRRFENGNLGFIYGTWDSGRDVFLVDSLR